MIADAVALKLKSMVARDLVKNVRGFIASGLYRHAFPHMDSEDLCCPCCGHRKSAEYVSKCTYVVITDGDWSSVWGEFDLPETYKPCGVYYDAASPSDKRALFVSDTGWYCYGKNGVHGGGISQKAMQAAVGYHSGDEASTV